MDLSDRGRVALKALRAYTDAAPAPTRATNWRVPSRAVYAFKVADALQRAGLQPPQRARPGRGEFVFWLTEEGVAVAAHRRR